MLQFALIADRWCCSAAPCSTPPTVRRYSAGLAALEAARSALHCSSQKDPVVFSHVSFNGHCAETTSHLREGSRRKARHGRDSVSAVAAPKRSH